MRSLAFVFFLPWILTNLNAVELSPEVLLSAALKSSARVKSIRELKKSAEYEKFQSSAALDTTLKGSTVWIDDRREPGSPFALSNAKTFQAELEATKYFSTGTLLGAKLSHTSFEATPGGAPRFKNYEPYGEVSIAQNLLKDFLGSDTRKELQAGEKLSKAKLLESDLLLESWALEIVETYLQARALQQLLLIFDDTALAREKLFRVSKLRARRGTLEEKDLKKIEASLSDVQLQRTATENTLRNLLFLLVTVAELPKEILQYDVRSVPLLGGRLSQQACSVQVEKSKAQKKAELEAEAYRLRATAMKGALLPELQVFAALGGNAVENENQEAWNDFSKDPQFVWRMGVQAKWILGNNANEARYLQARVASLDKEATARDEGDRQAVQTDDLCRSLNFYSNEVKNRNQAATLLKRSYTLQEKDFQIGRASVFDVVQSAEEWLGGRRALAESEKNLWYAKWRLLKHEDKLVSYLKQLEETSL